MRKLLVFQHVPYEPLGTFNPLIKDWGFRIRYVNFGRHPDLKPSLEGYSGLVILGGPMNLDQEKQFPHLKNEIKIVEEALKRQIPVLGICLGAQIIAKTLGAQVGPNSQKEIGWYPIETTELGKKDPIFQHFNNEEQIFQWHGDTFQIPQGAYHLAQAPTCANQAFRYGDKVYAFQFHLEVDEAMIERWLRVPHHVKEIAALKGKIDPQVIREKTPKYIERLHYLSHHTFGEFLKLFGVEKKYRCLPSR